MQEKERYVIKDRWIFDTKLNKNIHSIDCYEEKNVLDIMNGQNERIAELEEQLKKLQNQKAIEELEKIYNLFEPYENSQKDTILCANNGISFIDYLENQIESLKGEE